MSVLCRHYHVSLVAPVLSTGPCRVSNLLGLSKTQGGKVERFLFAHPGMPSRPDLSVIVALGLGVSPG